MKKKRSSAQLKAFTLTEVMIVLIIIGILILLALPNLLPLISRTRSKEAELQLSHLHMLQKTYFMQYAKFSSTVSEIGFEQVKLATEGGSAHYKIEIVDAGPKSFKARATAITDFDGDGVFNVWEVDQDKNLKEVTPD